MELSQEDIKKVLTYDLTTGVFKFNIYKVGMRSDMIAGCVNTLKYRCIRIDGRLYLAHRLAWCYVHGYYPKAIDHINGNRDDNRIENLREAHGSQNAYNSKKNKVNSSGFKGVTLWGIDKWMARCHVDGKCHFLGYYKTAESASYAYNEFAKTHHGEFYKDTL